MPTPTISIVRAPLDGSPLTLAPPSLPSFPPLSLYVYAWDYPHVAPPSPPPHGRLDQFMPNVKCPCCTTGAAYMFFKTQSYLQYYMYRGRFWLWTLILNDALPVCFIICTAYALDRVLVRSHDYATPPPGRAPLSSPLTTRSSTCAWQSNPVCVWS